MILFRDVEEDNILEWLANNSLCKLKEPFSKHIHGEVGYLLGANNGTHIVSPSHAEVDPIAPLYRSTQDKAYEIRLTIKSQPVGIPILEELTGALEERGFKEVEQFKTYKF